MTFGYSPFLRLSIFEFWKQIWEPNSLTRDAGLQDRARVRLAKAIATIGYSYGLLQSATKQTVDIPVPISNTDVAPAVAHTQVESESGGNRIAVVIPVLLLNDEHLAKLRSTLACLRAQSIKPNCVFLVDDGSPIPIINQLNKEALRGVTVIRCEHRGPAAARNKGLEAARGRRMDYVCFTDADCLPESTWLESMVCHFTNNPRDDLIGGMTQSLNRSAVDLFHDVYGTLNGRIFLNRTLLYTPTCNMGIRMKRVHVNFSSKFSEAAYEDIDFCIQARKSGAILKLAEEAKVVHDHNPSFVSLFHQFLRYGRSEQTLLKRHPYYMNWLKTTKPVLIKRLLKI